MKTKQEQTKQMLKILCDKFQCSAIDRSYMAKSCRQCEDIVEALHEAGYGDIKQAKIGVLTELEEKIQNAIDTYWKSDGGGYCYADNAIDEIDEMIEELKK